MMISKEYYRSIDGNNKAAKEKIIKYDYKDKISQDGGDMDPTQSNVEVPAGLFGFRKFAKTYIFGRERYDRREDTSLSNIHEKIQLEVRPGEHRESYENASLKDVSNEKGKEPVKEEGNSKVLKPDDESNIIISETPGTNQKKSSKSLENTESNLSGSRSATITETSSTLLNDKLNSIIIRNIPENTGLQSVLLQMMGGPLKNIVPIMCNDERKTMESVYIEFQREEDCAEFMKYGSTNLFVVNGRHPSVEWYFGEGYSKDNQNSHNTTSSTRGDHEECRQLMLKKKSQRKTLHKFSDVEDTLFVDFNLQELKTDFSLHGEIQDVTPIISRKLCIGIAYFDIQSAIKTMREYSDVHSDLHKKYFDTWVLWYGRDIADQPCIPL